MHARVASGVFLALGFADLAVLNLLLAPRLSAQMVVEPCPMPRPDPKAAPAETARVEEPAPPKVESPPPPKPEARVDIAMPDVLFGLQSERITRLDAALALQRVARALHDDPGRTLLLRGHSDRLGAPAQNVALSRRRAESVRHFLIAHGAPGDRITVEAVGDADPADGADTPTAWARNRRVQVLFR